MVTPESLGPVLLTEDLDYFLHLVIQTFTTNSHVRTSV